ncbi:MAG: hypothetical protein EOM05_10630, partial [Clostridia bacterium]|nr:hypothetical protein [Clostridia bacterium]
MNIEAAKECSLEFYENENSELMVEVIFSECIEQHYVLDSGILFGDLACVQIDDTEIKKTDDQYWDFLMTFYKYIKLVNYENLEACEASKVICESYFKIYSPDYRFTMPILGFLNVCHENNISVCKHSWYVFRNTYVITLPLNFSYIRYLYDNERTEYMAPFDYCYSDDSFFLKAINYDYSTGSRYFCDNFSDVLCSLLNEIVNRGYLLNKCQLCGRWFIPTKADEKYCSRSYDGVSCKQKAIIIKRQERRVKDVIGKAYNNVSTNLSNKISATTITDEEREFRERKYEQFKSEYRSKRKEYKHNYYTK